MRLIDADALLTEVENAKDLLASTKDSIRIHVHSAPTIDPFEDESLEQLMDECFNEGYRKAVRHGKWKVAGKTTHYYACSVCGKPGDGYDNYCRGCGAKMEGTEDV